MSKPDFFNEEKEYLSKTVSAIDDRIEKLKSNIDSQKNWALELKKQYIHDLRAFDEAEFVDNYSKLNEILDFTDDQIALMKRLSNVRCKPYFGRIDFKVYGDDQPMKLYIGIMSVDNNNELFVIDWRAPVSELFYEFGKGEASYDAPDGKIIGEVILKRQYDIEDAQLKDVYDVDANIFDEFLQQVLSKTKGNQLQNIVSTIQAEQNEIIRNLKDDVMVVQGYAGCGKTTIALHRVAYALYRLPNLSSANVLMFSPNDAFLSYISNVLPELGEDNTRSATFPKFVKRFLKTTSVVEPSDEFAIRYAFCSESEQSVIKTKLKFEMRDKMNKWLEKLNLSLRFEEGFTVAGHSFNLEMLNKLLCEDFKNAKYKEKIYLVCDVLCKSMGVEGIEKRDIVMEQIYAKLNQPVKLDSLYEKFLKDFKFKPINIDDKILFEDAVLLCVLKELCQNVIIKMDVRHIVLDEAQDYPLLFIDFLLRVFNHATFSIFGDINQKTVAGELNSLEDICKLEKALNRTCFYKLDKTYRSSEEIVEYASSLVGNPMHNAFRLKNGQPVDEILMADKTQEISQQILNLLEKFVAEKRTVGIIAGDLISAKEIYEDISKVIPETKLSFVKNAYMPAGTQVQIVPVALSKGLEFDSVIIVQKGKLFEYNDKNKFLYIAATRAINKLVVLKKKW